MKSFTDAITNCSPYNIVVLGDAKSGKTTLVHQYLYPSVKGSYKPTIEDCHRKLAQLPDGKYKTVNIIDTAGSMEFPAMKELRIRSATAIIIVYNVKDSSSIYTAGQLRRQIQEMRGYDDIPISVIGNLMGDSHDNLIQLQIPSGIMEDSTCEHFFTDLSATEQCEKVFHSVISKCYHANNWKVEVWTVTKREEDLKPSKKGRFFRAFSFRKKTRKQLMATTKTLP